MLIFFKSYDLCLSCNTELCRYKVKIHVTDEAMFVLFDSDFNYLIEKLCFVVVAAAKV